MTLIYFLNQYHHVHNYNLFNFPNYRHISISEFIIITVVCSINKDLYYIKYLLKRKFDNIKYIFYYFSTLVNRSTYLIFYEEWPHSNGWPISSL